MNHRSLLLAASILLAGADFACGQAYPTKPIRIVTAEPGGSNDFLSRLIGQGLSASLHQQIVVDNRASALVAPLVAKATPDGYTLLATTGILWIRPFLQSGLPDPSKDFVPITIAVGSPNIVVVHPSIAVGTIKELIALAKSKPGMLNYGSGATGSASHLAAELFKSMAGVDIVRVPYKSAGPAVNGLIAGQVQVMFGTASSVMPHIKSGRLKALAVTSAQPSEILPDLPTVIASGVPGYEAASVVAVMAPARTPAAIVDRLQREIVSVLNQPDTRSRLNNAGMEVIGSSPAQSAAMIAADMARMGKLIKEAGIRVE